MPKNETKQCQNCKNDFTIEVDDFGFYEKIGVPPPTFCPECRRQRRWAQKNNMSLYSGKCNLCAKDIISLYNLNCGFTVYCNKCWWSDKWDPKSFGRDYDFSRPFFEQFTELVKSVPQVAMVNDDGIASVNCEYSNDWWFSKNCYMTFVGWHVENSMYSYFLLAGKYMMDCLNIRSPNEWLYECQISAKSYQIKYSELILACVDSSFLYDCRNCSNCFMCVNLRNKQFYFKNKQYTKKEYEKIIEDYRLDTYTGVERAKKEFKEFHAGFFRKFAQNLQCVNVTGDLISHSKNIRNSFVIKNGENVNYSDMSGDSTSTTKDCFDITNTGATSESYEGVVMDNSQLNLFGFYTVKSQDVRYTEHCHNSKYLFGCVGLRNSKYCIFNKQYSKEEYEVLVQKIINHMNEMPYVDKQGLKYKYGEYYPIELSSFGYNETAGMENFSLSREEALAKGYKWQDSIQLTTGKETFQPKEIPDAINEVQDSILEEILKCIECNRNYKIVPNELTFYRQMKIPIPHKCFFCRHLIRIKNRVSFKLWHRSCMCEKENHDHKGKCTNEFETSYSPNRPEIVYCETCYQKEIY